MTHLEMIDVTTINHKLCPLCDSPETEGDFIEINDNTAQQKCHCLNCGIDWVMIYILNEVCVVKDV